MTTTPSLGHLSLRSPDALLASLPYLLGFHPTDSAVLVWLAGGRILLTQRLDLPTADVPLRAWHAAVWGHCAVAEAEELVLVLVTADDSGALRDLAATVADTAEERGIGMRDILRLNERRWWSLLCDDAACCPDEGRAVDPHVQDAIAAEFTGMGRAPVPDRDELVRAAAPDEALVAAVERVVAGLPEPHDLEAWRDERIDDLLRLMSGPGARIGDPDIAHAAEGILALADVRVRDTVLWEVSRWSESQLNAAHARLAALLRAAPDGLVAPVATCTAVVSWQLGDGARALVALDRAQHDDPHYSLARLVSASLAAGLAPRTWREAMDGLRRETCRHGAL